jgi:hypothetical protein
MTYQEYVTFKQKAKEKFGYNDAQVDSYLKSKGISFNQPSQTSPSIKDPFKKIGGFVKDVAADATKTLLVKPVTRAVQVGAYGVGALTKNEQLKDKALGDVQVGPFRVEAQKTGSAGVKQIVGDAAKSASYLYAPGGAGAAAQGFKQGLKQTIVQGVKAGALTGGAYASGSALQEDKDLLDTAKDTIVGAAFGGATGGALAGGLYGGAKFLQGTKNIITKTPTSGSQPSGLKNKVVTQLERKYDEIFTGTKSAKNAFAKSTQRGKTPSKFLAEHGYVVDVKGGKIDAASTIEKINRNAEPLEEVLDEILRTKDAMLPEANRVSLDILGTKAKQALNSESNKASGNLSKMYQQVDDVIAELKTQFGDSVDYSTLNSIKRGQWKQTKFDATRPNYAGDVNYKIGSAAKDTLEELIEETDIKGLNNYLGDHFDAIQNLLKVNGNAVKGGRLGNYFARTAGAIIGSHGGPVGSVVGMFGGDMVANIMQNNYIAGPIKRMMLQKIMTKATPASPIYIQAAAALSKLKNTHSMMRLPAPPIGSPKQSVNIPILQPRKINPVDKPFKGKGALSR